MPKTFVKSFVFASLLVIAYYIFQMARGMYMTITYKPDILQAYQAADNLSSTVTFGVAASTSEIVIEIVTILVIGAVGYLAGSYFLKKIRNS